MSIGRATLSLEWWYAWAPRHRWLMDLLLMAATGGVLLPISLFMIAPTVPAGVAPLSWWAILLLTLVTAHGVLVVRRTWPIISFMIVSAALAVQTLAPLVAYQFDAAFLPSSAVFPIALYSLCFYGPQWARSLGLAIGTIGAVMLTVRAARVFSAADVQAPWGAGAWALLLGVLLLVVFASWGSARLREVRLAYLDLLEERARRAEDDREEGARAAVREERARIAREMHDVVAHSLAVIVTQAQGGELVAAKSPDRAVAALNTIAVTGRLALTDMRQLLGVLRAPELDSSTTGTCRIEQPSGTGPQPTLAELPLLLDRVREAGLTVRRVDSGAPRPLGTATELAVYRLVQEALTNTLRHAGLDAHAELLVAWGVRELVVTISDNGPGATSDHNPGNTASSSIGNTAGHGHGLVGMRERVAVLGGTLTVGPKSEGGFAVHAVLPTANHVTEQPLTGCLT